MKDQLMENMLQLFVLFAAKNLPGELQYLMQALNIRVREK